MPSVITVRLEMRDPRTGNAQRHELLDLPVTALAASVRAAETGGPCRLAGDRKQLLREFPSLGNGSPEP